MQYTNLGVHICNQIFQVIMLVRGSHSAYLDCLLPGIKVTTRLGFFCIQVIYVIVKIVTPYFHRPSLISRSVVG